MLPAVHPRLAALDVEVRFRRAGVMCATPAVNVHHAVLSMFPAVQRRLAALNVKFSMPGAGTIVISRAPFSTRISAAMHCLGKERGGHGKEAVG